MTTEAAGEFIFNLIVDQDNHDSWLAEAHPKDGPMDNFLNYLKPAALKAKVQELLKENPEVLEGINGGDENDSNIDDDEESDDGSYQQGSDTGSADEDSETSDGSSQNKKKKKKRRVQGKKS